MMPNLEYFLVCESISTDAQTNRVSLFNVLEDIKMVDSSDTGEETFHIAQFTAIACWNRDNDDGDTDFQAMLKIHPSPEVEPKSFPLNFQMERPRKRVVFRFVGLPRLVPGPLKFELLLNGEHVAWHTVNVSAPDNDPTDGNSEEAD